MQVPENTEASNIGSVVFTDADLNDVHQVTVDDSRFEVINGMLALKPGVTIDHESEDTIPLQITVTDSAGVAAVHEFIIDITDVNEAPSLQDPQQKIDSETGTESFSFTVPTELFFDVDGDQLIISASLANGSPLPSWIEFDAENLIFNVSEDINVFDQTASVMLTATDPNGLSTTSNVFDIKVEPPIAAACLLYTSDAADE